MNTCCKQDTKNYKKIEESVDILKAISEPNRLKILCSLLNENICVCDLASKLGIAQNLLSFHLKNLFDEGILEKKRDGNYIYYIINKDWEKRIKKLFQFLDIN